MSDENEDDLPVDATGSPSSTVPYARFYQTNEKRKAALREVKELKSTIADLRGELGERDATIQGFSAVQDELSTLQAQQSDWALEKDIFGAGVTDADAVKFAKMAYGSMPEDGRPAVSDWLSEESRESLSAPVRRALFGDGGGDGKTERKVPLVNNGVHRHNDAGGRADVTDAIRRGDARSVREQNLQSLGIDPATAPWLPKRN